MIYFDNAATTMQKPSSVVKAVTNAMTTFGGVGRGVHAASFAADMGVYQAREALARLFGVPSSSRVAFSSNVTESLNIALFGLLNPGDHVITTMASHNSMLRPLYLLEERGVELSIAPIGGDGSLDYDRLETLFKENTKVLAINHASNLTGDVYDVERLARMAHAHGALVVLDAAQSAGVIPLDMERQGIDVLCFTGHKSLYGPQGTGGLCVSPDIDIAPMKVGGSGTQSFDRRHPSCMPDRLEAGTLNAHGLAGLRAGVEFVESIGSEVIHQKELSLRNRFVEGLSSLPCVTIYGGGESDTCAIVALNVEGLDSGILSARLNDEYGICVRAGAHCAPLMHEALDTVSQGAVRFSFSYFNTEDEIDLALKALHELAGRLG